jgi:aminoglycoside phosphotransferase (APT) family kinase protein
MEEVRGLLGSDLDSARASAVRLVSRWRGEALAEAGATVIDDGWDFRVFHVGAWVLRVARHAAAVASMRRETRVLTVIRKFLDVPVPQPVECLPGVTVGPWLEGRPLRAADLTHVGGDLARNVHTLHSLGLRAVVPEPRNVVGERRSGAAAILDDALRAGLRSREVEILASGLRQDAMWQFTPVVVHADLTPGHILVSRDGSQLAGLIDWSDLRYDDPAIDIAGVGSELGEPSGAMLRAAYARFADPGQQFDERVCFCEARARVIEALHAHTAVT